MQLYVDDLPEILKQLPDDISKIYYNPKKDTQYKNDLIDHAGDWDETKSLLDERIRKV